MYTRRFRRRLLAGFGAAGLIAMGVLTAACGGNGGQPPSSTTTTTTTTTTTSVSPTEKSINPTGGNLFTPPVTASPAPNVPGGQHPGLNGVN
jgi:hypothetical protein